MMQALRQVQAVLPFRSPLLIGCALVVLAAILGIPLNSHPGWWFLVPVVIAAVAAGLDELRSGGVSALATLPASRALRTTAFAVLAALTLTITVQELSFALVPVVWLIALVFVAWGVAVRRDALEQHAGLDPVQLLHGYRSVLLIGGAVAVVAMLLSWGSSRTVAGPGFGYGCDLAGDCGTGFGFGLTFSGGIPFDGRGVEFGDWAVLVLLLVPTLGVLSTGWAPAWLRRFGPLTAAGVLTLWFVILQFTSVLVDGGGKSFGFYLFILGLVILDAGAVLLAMGVQDGRYTPAALLSRARSATTTAAATPPPPPPPPPPPAIGEAQA